MSNYFGERAGPTARHATGSTHNGGTPLQTPMRAPESSTSMEEAREIFGRPSISIMLPAITTTNPAPAESEALVTLSVQTAGAPRRLGSSDKEYCVLAMQTGNFAWPQSVNCWSLALACSLK